MSLHLYGLESLVKSMHKATVRLHLLFWQQAVVFESYKHSNNLRMSFSFTQKSVNPLLSLLDFGLYELYTSVTFSLYS